MTESQARETFIGDHEVTLCSLTFTGTERSIQRMMASMGTAGIQFMVNGRSTDDHGETYTLRATAYKIHPKE